MAADGRFTYEDLYAGQSPNYYHRPLPMLSNLNIPTRTTIISTTDIHSKTKLNKLADIIPFNYLYWILLVLAILLIITLIVIFIHYCRTFIKHHRTRSGSLTSFYRRGTVNPLINTHKFYQSKAKSAVPPMIHGNFLTPPCPSHSLKSLDDQIYRRNSDTSSSPQIARHDVFLKEPLSTFSHCTSSLSSISASRLSARLSDAPLKVEQLYESQRASMALNEDADDTKITSLIVDLS